MVLESPEPYNFRYRKLLGKAKTKKKQYQALESKSYFSKRYRKYVTIVKGEYSDGATDAPDIRSFAWWVHDRLCATGKWDDGTLCSNWQASMVLKDILKQEGRWLRDFWWASATFLFGGGEARRNGLFYANMYRPKSDPAIRLERGILTIGFAILIIATALFGIWFLSSVPVSPVA